MSVLAVVKVSGNTEVFQKSLIDRADEYKAIGDRAKGSGAIHHRFGVGDGFVQAIDEWETAEQFQQFFSDPKLQEFIVTIGGGRYAVELRWVREVVSLGFVTNIPTAPPALEMVIWVLACTSSEGAMARATRFCCGQVLWSSESPCYGGSGVPAFLAAFSIAALPPRTIKSASETFLPPEAEALNSFWIASSFCSTVLS